MPERFKVFCVACKAIYKCSALPLTIVYNATGILYAQRSLIDCCQAMLARSHDLALASDGGRLRKVSSSGDESPDMVG